MRCDGNWGGGTSRAEKDMNPGTILRVKKVWSMILALLRVGCEDLLYKLACIERELRDIPVRRELVLIIAEKGVFSKAPASTSQRTH
jgi:hypothetical protein